MTSNLRDVFMQGVTPQASPAAIQVNLGACLPLSANDDVDLFIRRMDLVTVVNPHIWEAGARHLPTPLFHYAVRLMGLLTDRYDSADAHMEDIFEECNEQASLHYSMNQRECMDVIKAFVVPCHPKGGYIPCEMRMSTGLVWQLTGNTQVAASLEARL